MGVHPRGSAPQCGPSGLQMAWQSLIVVANIAGFPSLPRHSEDKALWAAGQGQATGIEFGLFQAEAFKTNMQPFSSLSPTSVHPEVSC